MASVLNSNPHICYPPTPRTLISLDTPWLLTQSISRYIHFTFHCPYTMPPNTCYPSYYTSNSSLHPNHMLTYTPPTPHHPTYNSPIITF